MMTCMSSDQPARTVLESLIWQRRQTHEEFVEHLETLARQHGERGTLSLRHLQRLVAGVKADGTPIGRPYPSTARLLEIALGLPVEQLLARPESCPEREAEPHMRATTTRLHHIDRLDVIDAQLDEIVQHLDVLRTVLAARACPAVTRPDCHPVGNPPTPKHGAPT